LKRIEHDIHFIHDHPGLVCDISFLACFSTWKPPTLQKAQTPDKKVQKAIASKPAPLPVTGEQLRNNAMKLLKKNPEVISKVVKQWLRGV
jgi:hypothetical protein